MGTCTVKIDGGNMVAVRVVEVNDGLGLSLQRGGVLFR